MQFDNDGPQNETLARYPSQLTLDDTIAIDDTFQALSRTTEGVISSSAQSPRGGKRRRRNDKDTGPPEVLGDQINTASNHQFCHWHSTPVEMNVGIPLQG